MMKRPYYDLSTEDYAKLVKGSIILTMAGRCELSVDDINKEPQFLMTGPSGRHTLAVSETSLCRLNAHWKGFVYTPGNGLV